MGLFLISCGGTGGHLSPGISLAEGLQARGHETLLLISQKKVDARLSENYPHLRFLRMPGSGFGWHPVTLAKCAVSQARAVRFCLRLIRTHRPAAIVGFGGFTSAPLVLAGRIAGVPSALHESNRVPGRAIRTLGRFARRVYLPPGISLPAVRSAATRHVGLPVRREIVRQPAGEARTALGLDPRQRVLVVLGGSQGASPLNDWARDALPAFAAEGIQLYVVTGLGKGREGAVESRTAAGDPVRAHFVPFTDRMAAVLSAADLVVSRAGAGTIAELIRCETPAILVPYPQAADDHQRANAAWFAQEGGGLAVAQTELGELRSIALGALRNDAWLRGCREHLKRMDRANALDLMLADLEEIARRPAGPRGAPLLVA